MTMKTDEDGDAADDFIICDAPPKEEEDEEEDKDKEEDGPAVDAFFAALTYEKLHTVTFAFRQELKRRVRDAAAALVDAAFRPARMASDFVARVLVSVQVLLLSVTNCAQPGLYNMPDQNQTDANKVRLPFAPPDEPSRPSDASTHRTHPKARIGATGGRRLDPSRGLKYHDAPESGIRDIVSSEGAFGNVSRGDPLPSKLSASAKEAAGLTEDTWKLEVSIDSFLQRHHVKRGVEAEREVLVLDLPALKAIGERRGTVRYALRRRTGRAIRGRALD